MQAAEAARLVWYETTDASRGAHQQWIGVDCAWTGRGQPVQALAVSTCSIAAVVSLSDFGGELPTTWQILLAAPHIFKSCSSLPAVEAGLTGAEAVFYKFYDPAHMVYLDHRMPNGRHSLSVVLLHVHGYVLPSARELRALSWGGALSEPQVRFLALHAYGAFSCG